MTRYFFQSFFVAAVWLLMFGNAQAWEGIVVKVIDGDSLKVRRDGRIVELRLYGIDAPEYRQPYSNKAKQHAKRLVFQQMVTVHEKDTDRYGRIVALVTSRDVMLNREMVRAGLAWYYPKYCRDQPLCGELMDLEDRARKERRGLWRETDPVAPWDWKRQQKSSGSEGRSRRFDRWYDRFIDLL